MENRIVIKETKNDITYLQNVCKYDDIDNGYQPKTGKDDFYLMFDIITCSKPKTKTNEQAISTREKRYMMYVNKVDGHYQTMLHLDSDSFSNGEGISGHSQPSGEWYSNNELGDTVLDYYFSHRETVPEITENIDVSQWSPLITLAKSKSSQQYVLKLTAQEFPDVKSFSIDCKILDVNNVLINNELANYSISTCTLYFYPVDDTHYVQINHTSTKTYTDGGKRVTELQGTGRTESARPVYDIGWTQKIFDYYLAHKSEIEVKK
jgi:hypothetical protein